MMDPPFFIKGKAFCTAKKTPRALMSKVLSYCSGLTAVVGIGKIAEAGDLLGLNATISNLPYEVTAEMMELGQANFVPREPLVLMMREFSEVALRIAASRRRPDPGLEPSAPVASLELKYEAAQTRQPVVANKAAIMDHRNHRRYGGQARRRTCARSAS